MPYCGEIVEPIPTSEDVFIRKLVRGKI